MGVKKIMGYRVTKKENLNDADFFMEVEAPHIARSWKVGQFVILIPDEKGERVPMSVYYAKDERIGMFIRRLGVTSLKLWYEKNVGDELFSVAGPLGKPIEVRYYGNVVFVSDAVCGYAESYATLRAMKKAGNYAIAIQTFESATNVYPEKYLSKAVADEYYLTTEDGSIGIRGHYLDVLKELIEKGKVDIVFGGGKLTSLKRLAELTKPYGIPTIVSVRQIMVDGTGMCGSCRVLYDGQIKFVCRDGPMMNAHKIDWDDVIKRNNRFIKQEKLAKERYLVKLKEKRVI